MTILQYSVTVTEEGKSIICCKGGNTLTHVRGELKMKTMTDKSVLKYVGFFSGNDGGGMIKH